MSHPLVILIIDDSKGYTLYLKKLIKYTNIHGHPVQIISIDDIERRKLSRQYLRNKNARIPSEKLRKKIKSYFIVYCLFFYKR